MAAALGPGGPIVGDIGSVIDNTIVKIAKLNFSYNLQFQSFSYNKRIACNLQSIYRRPHFFATGIGSLSNKRMAFY